MAKLRNSLGQYDAFQKITRINIGLKQITGEYVRHPNPDRGIVIKEITVQQICFPSKQDISVWKAIWVRYPISAIAIEGFFNPLITYDYSALTFTTHVNKFDPGRFISKEMRLPQNSDRVIQKLYEKFSEYWSCPQKFVNMYPTPSQI